MKKPISYIALATLVFMLAVALSACEKETALDLGQEKVAYLSAGSDFSNVMVSTISGGDGQALMKWRGSGDDLTFANNGGHFSISIGSAGGNRAFIIGTDGRSITQIPQIGTREMTFSPDSSSLAYIAPTATGPGSNQIGIIEIESGLSRVLATGDDLSDPVWQNNDTLVFSENSNGTVHMANVTTGEQEQLSTGTQRFVTAPLRSSFAGEKIALIGEDENQSLWSIDPSKRELTQVTNNIFKYKAAGYLPDSDTIMFIEESLGLNICTLSDDGLQFRMLTDTPDINISPAVSLGSGKVVYLHADKDIPIFPKALRGRPVENPASVWVMNSDGSDKHELMEGNSSRVVSNPVFAPVSDWRETSSLDLHVNHGSQTDVPGITISVTNTTDNRANGELSISRLPTSLADSDVYTLPVELDSGEEKELELPRELFPGEGPAPESLLITISQPGVIPFIFWCELESCQL